MRTDVLIVGAGPTGLALAAQLKRFDVDFVIVDVKEGTTPHSKAIGVQARTLEIYEQIGLANSLVERGWKADKVRLLESGTVRAELDLGNIGTGMSPYPFLLIVEQGIHESLLYQHLLSKEVNVLWTTELTGFSQNESGITGKLKSGNDTVSEVAAKFLVGCDGAHSLVRHSLGLKFEGSTFERLFYVADVMIDWKFAHDALHVNLGNDTLTAFFPMPGDRRWRIVGTFPEDHTKDEGEILYEEIEQQVIADTGLEFDITQVNWFSVYKVHSRHVSAFSSGRCFLAGDSAHIHSPAGAQGMNTGIQDGYNLAWKLAAVLKNNAGLELLATYNEERLPNAHRLLRTTDRFFQLGASDEWLAAFFRTKILPYIANFALNLEMVRNAIFPLVSQIGINYRGSRLSVSDGDFSVEAGDRMPWFEIEGASIYNGLRDPKFHILVFEDGSEAAPIFESEFAIPVDVQRFSLYPHIAEIFGTSKSFVVVLRPDNHIGYIGHGNSFDIAQNYLKEILQ